MGRWSARLAPLFLGACDLAAAARVLDVGCGTGSLTRALRARHPAAELIGLDLADEFIAHAKAELSDGRAWFCRGDAQSLPFAEDRFDAALGLLILQQMSEPARLVAEMRRVVRPGGLAATCIWDFEGGMPMFQVFWGAVEKVDPATAEARRAKKPRPLVGTSEDSLATLWREAGLAQVEASTVALRQDFAGLQDFWTPFLSDATPSASVANKMDAATRAAVKEEVRVRLFGAAPEGPFSLEARAFVVHGRVPEA